MRSVRGKSGLATSWPGAALALALLGAHPALARHAPKPTPAPASQPPPIAPDTDAPAEEPAPARPSAHAETLDNATVTRLSKAGLPGAALTELIRTSPGAYDIGTDALLALTQAGVPAGALAAMIKVQRKNEAEEVRPDSPNPADPHPAGVYVLAGWLKDARMLAIKPVTTTRTTSGSVLGYAYAGGLIPVRYRAILPTPHAEMLAGESRPTFYFFTAANADSQHLRTVWGAAPDPDELRLVRFAETKNGREVEIGSFNLRGATIGVPDKAALPVLVREAAPGVIAVQPQTDLVPGEYGFVQTAAGVGTGGAQASTTSARVFAFAVASDAAISRGWASRTGSNGRADQVEGTTATVNIRITPTPVRVTTQQVTVRPKPEPNSNPSLYPK